MIAAILLQKEGHMKVTARGIEINYELSGEGDCLVMVHGFTDNLTMWYNQIPVFSSMFKVLTVDVRGHGKTETPEGDLSMELFADDLHAVLEALNIEKACVLGYSMGGRIGLQFALKHPEKTTGLVFANSGVIGPEMKFTKQEMAEMVERRKQLMDLVETGEIEVIADAMAERSLSPGFRDKEPAVFQKYKEVKLQNDPRHYVPIMQSLADAMANPPDLTQLKCPALVIAGEYDAFMAVDVAKSMEKAINDATVKILPTGHAAAIEAPEDFNRAVIDFMNRL